MFRPLKLLHDSRIFRSSICHNFATAWLINPYTLGEFGNISQNSDLVPGLQPVLYKR